MSTKKFLVKKPSAETVNQNMMVLIRKVHGMIDKPDIEKHRQSQDHVGELFGKTKDMLLRTVDIQEMAGEWVSVNRAHMKKYIILYCHGGGYMTGSSLYARELTTKLSRHTGLSVFCFDYRLAPEFPYPAAVEDALTAWSYILSCGYDAKDIIVAGDSAGGNLALVLTLLLREQHAKLPKSLVLFSPWTDMTSSGKSYHAKELVDPVLTNAYIQKAVSCYLGDTPADSPYVSPLFADLSGFPPVYIQAGTNEILLDDSHSLYKQLLTHNIYAKLDIFDGMWHVFQMSPIAKAEEAVQKAALFIK